MLAFWRYGYEETSITHLTSQIGINAASLYAAFGSKKDLFLEALAHYRTGVGSGMGRILGSAPTAREAIRLLLQGTVAAVTQRSAPRGCMVVLSAMHGFAESAEIDQAMRRCRAEDHAMVLGRLRKGIVDGELPQSCDIEGLAALYMAVLQGMSVQARDDAAKGALLAMARNAMRAWPDA